MPFEWDPFGFAPKKKIASRSDFQSELSGVFPKRVLSRGPLCMSPDEILDPQRLSEGYSSLNLDDSFLLDYIQSSLHRRLPGCFKPSQLIVFSKLKVKIDFLAQKGLPLGKIPKRISNCHGDFLVLQNRKEGNLVARPYCCGVRLCPLCTAYRSNRSRDSITDKVGRMDNHMLWTFTMRHSSKLLSTQHKEITQWFSKLRRTKCWLDNTKGCVWVFEYAYNSKRDEWHPHIHAIVDTSFIPFFELQAHWRRITNGSHSINFKGFISEQKSIGYVLKYLTKPQNTSKWPIYRLGEFLLCMQGRRLFGSTGSAFGLSDAERMAREIKPRYELLGWLSRPFKWIQYTRGGDSQVRELISELSDRWLIDPWEISALPP